MRTSWIKTLVVLFLIVGLPIFVWAVATQRIELRKKAATSEPPQICWNRVISFNNTYNWPNSCKGNPRTDLVCSQVLIPLTADEITGYQRWVSAGRPYIPGCGPAPTPTIPGECTSCETTGVCIEGLVCQTVQVGPGGCRDDGTGHQLCWDPAIRKLCVKSDGSSNCIIKPSPTPYPSCTMPPPCAYAYPPCTYAVQGVTYCPRPTPTCTPIPPCYYYEPRCTLLSSISYCPPTTPTPSQRCTTNGASCTITNCPPMPTCPAGQACPQVMPPCTAQPGICQNNRCVPYSCGPNGSTCTITTCPPMPTCPAGQACPQVMPPCTAQPGICQNNHCIPCTMPPPCAYANPSCTYAVQGVIYCPINPTPTPTPPPGCYYQQVQCIQAPCPPILVCPTITPTPKPYIKVLTPNGGEQLAVGQSYTIRWESSGFANYLIYLVNSLGQESLINGVSAANTSYTWIVNSPIMQNTQLHKIKIVDASQGGVGSATQDLSDNFFTISSSSNLNPPLCGQSTIPPATGPAPLTVFLHGSGSAGNGPGFDGYRWDFDNNGSWDTGVLTDPVTHIYTQSGTYYPKYQVHGTNNVWSAVCSYPYTISVTPTPINLTFKVKLAGVNGPEAKGAAITVKLKLQNGTVLPIDKPLVLNSVGNGVYEATATLTNPLPSGTAMRVLVKGEKHSQIVFCRQSGQTEPCNDTDYITPSSYSFDFTGRPLPPGDLNQDGKVNTADLKLITDLFNKTSTQLTPQDLKTADVDYSGTIDAFDLNLVLQTLETRYDEQ